MDVEVGSWKLEVGSWKFDDGSRTLTLNLEFLNPEFLNIKP